VVDAALTTRATATCALGFGRAVWCSIAECRRSSSRAWRCGTSLPVTRWWSARAVTALTFSVLRPRGRALDRRHVHRHTDRDELRNVGVLRGLRPGDLLGLGPGASSEGIIVFPPINRAGNFRVILAGYTGGDSIPTELWNPACICLRRGV